MTAFDLLSDLRALRARLTAFRERQEDFGRRIGANVVRLQERAR